MHNKLKLFVISHTHWDREWYQTFQQYRKRLVFMMDELIEHMEKNPDYKYFHMDGQTIVLEDYLEIRRENEKRLKALIQQGRIIVGPWYVMPDEFLVSGESLVRNIQKGFQICGAYGVEPMKCGYVTDIFGHNSQFPQILNGFGIDSALLYRGIGDYPKDAFTWVAANGSSVLCLKMDRERSYSNFYFSIRWPFEGREFEEIEAVTRMKELVKLSKELAVSENILMMDGVDHIEMEPRIPEILSLFNEKIDDIEIVHSRLEEFVEVQRSSTEELEEIRGELYNPGLRGVNNQVLKNVLSSMVHIKQMNNACETLLTRWAEPFEAAAAYLKPQNNKGFLDEAWKHLLQNHPHDSICGCSISRVHKDNEYRYDQVMDIGGEIVSQVLGEIAASIDTKSNGREYISVIFNASQKDFEGIFEAELEFPAGSQGNFRLYDSAGNEVPYQVLGVKRGTLKKVVKFRKLIDFQSMDVYRVAFYASIPAVGYCVYGYEEYKNVLPGPGEYTYKEFHAPVRYPGTMQTGHRTWENEYLRVEVQSSGVLIVFKKETGKEYRDLLIFEDCADVGDGWNYRKPLKDSRYLSINGKCDFSVEYDGPMAMQLKITHMMNLPTKMGDSGVERSESTEEFKITTLVSMKKGSSILEFKTLVDNNVGEHRLRVLFPSYLNTDRFFTSTPFYLQERRIQKPDWSSNAEVETGVYPNQGVVVLKDDKDCLALYNKGLYEIEVTEDESHTLALTLFRSFRNEVGRNIGEMSFMYRRMAFEYALEFNSEGIHPGDIMVSGEAWRSGLKAVYTSTHEGSLPEAASFLKVKIPGAVLSAFKAGIEGMKVLRLYNCTEESTKGYIEFFKVPEKAFLLDLNEEVLGEIGFEENKVKIELNPAQIITIGVKI